MADITEQTDFVGTSVTAFSGSPTIRIWYTLINQICYVTFYMTGTSNSTSTTFTVPFTSRNVSNNRVKVAIASTDNSVALTGAGSAVLPANSATVTCYVDVATGAWTNSGTKVVEGQFWYEIA